MAGLNNKRLLLGISGGIAAYKSAYLARLLVQAGAQVRVVMTQGAQAFIQPLTFQALTGNPVHTALLDPEAEAGMGHIELARWAEAILIVPSTADLMARLAQGRADDLLTTLVLASQAPIYLAPAMNQAMWQHPATQKNLAQLHAFNYQVLTPAAGEQACGDVGLGRLPEPEEIYAWLHNSLNSNNLHSNNLHSKDLNTASQPAAGLKFLITAGPTQEALDPVRYLSNHSSGKMGYALAAAALKAGAQVDLVSGPVSIVPPAGANLISVVSAQQMLEACQAQVSQCDILIACAAVADYRAEEVAEQKIKKQNGHAELTLKLIQNPDILASLTQGSDKLFSVGFAAETENVEVYAQEKLIRKNLNALVANDVSDSSIGFGSDENRVILFSRKQDIISRLSLPQTSKQLLAEQLIHNILSLYKEEK